MTDEAAPVVRIEKMISAEPARVYRAWLDPQLLARWMAPGSLVVSDVKVEERAGGRYHVQQSASGRLGGGFDCEIVELVPHERIVFHWGFAGPDWREGPIYDSRLTLSFAAVGSNTRLTLLHERLDALQRAMPQVANLVETGWHMVLDKLDTLLQAPA